MSRVFKIYQLVEKNMTYIWLKTSSLLINPLSFLLYDFAINGPILHLVCFQTSTINCFILVGFSILNYFWFHSGCRCLFFELFICQCVCLNQPFMCDKNMYKLMLYEYFLSTTCVCTMFGFQFPRILYFMPFFSTPSSQHTSLHLI